MAIGADTSTSELGLGFLAYTGLNIFFLAVFTWRFRRTRDVPTAFLLSMALIQVISTILYSISEFLLDKHIFAIAAVIDLSVCLLFLAYFDYNRRESLEPIKFAFGVVCVFGALWSIKDPEAVVVLWSDPGGRTYLFLSGDLGLFFLLLQITTAVFILIFFWLLVQRVPKRERLTRIYLLYMICMGFLVEILTYSSGVTPLGNLFAYILFFLNFVIEKHQCTILPFKVLRLTAINTKSGTALFTHTWRSGEPIIDEDLFSGFLQGFRGQMQESVPGRGEICQIQLNNCALLFEQNNTYSVGFVLVTTRSSRLLWRALKSFGRRFCATFAPFTRPEFVDQFAGAKKIIEDVFSFVPDYEEEQIRLNQVPFHRDFIAPPLDPSGGYLEEAHALKYPVFAQRPGVPPLRPPPEDPLFPFYNPRVCAACNHIGAECIFWHGARIGESKRDVAEYRCPVCKQFTVYMRRWTHARATKEMIAKVCARMDVPGLYYFISRGKRNPSQILDFLFLCF